MKIIDADAFEKYAWGNPDIEVDGEPYISPSTVQNFAADHPITIDPPNEPLTLAELREMDGEPVWVEHNNGGEWMVIHWDYVGRITTAYKACLLDHEYGRTWLAYRHPLEGEANG